MITYFPEPYEDELAYSLFARYYMKSGYTTLRDVMDELYVNKWYRADTLFFNKLKPDVVDIITRNVTMQEFIERHTMFPYYARFIKKERRDKAIQSMINMDGNYHNLLPIPNGIHDRYLRYCPVCSRNDREKYGEAYWHRIHQMDGVDICPIHKCILINSSVAIGVKDSAGLVPAEQEIEDAQPIYSHDEKRNTLADYIMQVFLAEMDYDADGIGSFLRSNLNEKYISNTGVTIKVEDVFNDFKVYFSSDPNVGDLQRVQKIFNDYRWNCIEICQLALFLNISINSLVNYKGNNHELLSNTYTKLAEEHNLDYDIVAALGKEIIRDYEKSFARRKSGVRQKKWDELDAYYLPKVKDIIEQSLSNHDERPVKISSYWVCRQLGITSKQMDKLPLCKAEIEKYSESQEHYWAREVLWAIKKIDDSGIDLCWRRVRELINIRKVNCESCMSILKELTDTVTYERIRQLL